MLRIDLYVHSEGTISSVITECGEWVASKWCKPSARNITGVCVCVWGGGRGGGRRGGGGEVSSQSPRRLLITECGEWVASKWCAGALTGRGVILNRRSWIRHARMRGATLSACLRVSDPLAVFCVMRGPEYTNPNSQRTGTDHWLQRCDHYCKALAHSRSGHVINHPSPPPGNCIPVTSLAPGRAWLPDIRSN